MKYILMTHIPKAGYRAFGAWSQKDVKANIAFVRGINKTLSDSGEFVAAEGSGNAGSGQGREGGQRRGAHPGRRVPGIERISVVGYFGFKVVGRFA
jgi:hypothetical protein